MNAAFLTTMFVAYWIVGLFNLALIIASWRRNKVGATGEGRTPTPEGQDF